MKTSKALYITLFTFLNPLSLYMQIEFYGVFDVELLWFDSRAVDSILRNYQKFFWTINITAIGSFLSLLFCLKYLPNTYLYKKRATLGYFILFLTVHCAFRVYSNYIALPHYSISLSFFLDLIFPTFWFMFVPVVLFKVILIKKKEESES